MKPYRESGVLDDGLSSKAKAYLTPSMALAQSYDPPEAASINHQSQLLI